MAVRNNDENTEIKSTGHTKTEEEKEILNKLMGEPHFQVWRHRELLCAAIRMTFTRGGHLCGYVGLKDGHPLNGMDYDDVSSIFNIKAHGGLTYSADYAPVGISHDVFEESWWFGFDTAHVYDEFPSNVVNDLNPFANETLKNILEGLNAETMGSIVDYNAKEGHIEGTVYRDMDYVVKQTNYLAKQLAFFNNNG